MKLRLGIVGHGFVGQATSNAFNKNIEKFLVDPKLNSNIKDLSKFSPEIIFICVPTPMKKNGVQDSSIIEEVLSQIKEYCPKAVNVVKSTVLPSILKNLNKIDENLIYNPEFLREKHAEEDFLNSEFIIFGGKKDLALRVSRAYKENSSCITKKYIFTDLVTASFAKYVINTFLASKVIFFNEMHSLFLEANPEGEWREFLEIIALDDRLGKSHMNVPGHDGKKGFGGACFPKDSFAFVNYADSLKVDLNILKEVINVNNSIRQSYDALELREIEQNISFSDKILKKSNKND